MKRARKTDSGNQGGRRRQGGARAVPPAWSSGDDAVIDVDVDVEDVAEGLFTEGHFTTSLLAAAAAGDVAALSNALSCGADACSVTLGAEATPALALAAGAPDAAAATAAVRALLAAGARAGATDAAGSTALHVAARSVRPRCVRALLAAGCPADCADAAGVTPLHALCAAATAGGAPPKAAADVVSALLEAGANAAAADARGVTPTDAAAALVGGAHAEGVLAPLRAAFAATEAARVRRANASAALRMACAMRDADAAAQALAAGAVAAAAPGADGNDGRDSLTHVAARGAPGAAASAEAAAALLRVLMTNDAAAVHARDGAGFTALHVAVARNNLIMAAALLDAGATIDAEVLVPAGASAFPDGATALRLACRTGASEAASLLLRRGAVAGRRSSRGDGGSALHDAARGGHVALAAALLAAGADGAAAAADGTTPLHAAAAADAPDIVSLLLPPCEGSAARAAAAALVAASDGVGRTPLHSACAAGATSCVALLCSAGADVAAADAGGNAPLHAAAAAGNVDCVRLLLRAGADPAALALRLRNNAVMPAADVDGTGGAVAPEDAVIVGAGHPGSWAGCGGNAEGVAHCAGFGNCGIRCLACGAGTHWSCCGSAVHNSDGCSLLAAADLSPAQASANAAACFARAAAPCRVAELPGSRFPPTPAAGIDDFECGFDEAGAPQLPRVGSAVRLADGFAAVGDAADGPLAPEQEGRVCAADEAARLVTVRAPDGRTWDYAPAALQRIGVQPGSAASPLRHRNAAAAAPIPAASALPPPLRTDRRIGAPHPGTWGGCGGNPEGVAWCLGGDACSDACDACGASTHWSCCGSTDGGSTRCTLSGALDDAQAAANAAACKARADEPRLVKNIPGVHYAVANSGGNAGQRNAAAEVDDGSDGVVAAMCAAAAAAGCFAEGVTYTHGAWRLARVRHAGAADELLAWRTGPHAFAVRLTDGVLGAPPATPGALWDGYEEWALPRDMPLWPARSDRTKPEAKLVGRRPAYAEALALAAEPRRRTAELRLDMPCLFGRFRIVAAPADAASAAGEPPPLLLCEARPAPGGGTGAVMRLESAVASSREAALTLLAGGKETRLPSRAAAAAKAQAGSDSGSSSESDSESDSESESESESDDGLRAVAYVPPTGPGYP